MRARGCVHLRVDGGMARNAWFLQCQADVLGLPVLQSTASEATALGAAYLAGLAAGVWPDVEALRKLGTPGNDLRAALAGRGAAAATGAVAAGGAGGDRLLSGELTSLTGHG